MALLLFVISLLAQRNDEERAPGRTSPVSASARYTCQHFQCFPATASTVLRALPGLASRIDIKDWPKRISG